jgi:hypothetical protein
MKFTETVEELHKRIESEVEARLEGEVERVLFPDDPHAIADYWSKGRLVLRVWWDELGVHFDTPETPKGEVQCTETS